MKKTLRYFGYGLVIALMAAAVLVLLAPRFGCRVDTVLSGSMAPQFKVGDLVVTRSVEVKDIKVGDAITFRSPLNGNLISHRVTAVSEDSPLGFQTKGDANEEPDPFIVPARNVVGKVCLHVPNLGYVTQFLKTRMGFVLAICLPGLIVIAVEMMNIWQVLTEEEMERKRTKQVGG